MENLTQKITLPSGKVVEVLAEAPAWILLDITKHEGDARQKFLFESMVISFDGVKENIYDGVRNLNIRDFKKLDGVLTGLLTVEELPN